jgi:hypothetical protein
MRAPSIKPLNPTSIARDAVNRFPIGAVARLAQNGDFEVVARFRSRWRWKALPGRGTASFLEAGLLPVQKSLVSFCLNSARGSSGDWNCAARAGRTSTNIKAYSTATKIARESPLGAIKA